LYYSFFAAFSQEQMNGRGKEAPPEKVNVWDMAENNRKNW